MDYMDYVFVLGRILYGGFFLMGGINHFMSLGMMSGYAASKGVPAAKPGVMVSGLLIIIGGLLVILGWHVRIGLVFILAFLVPVTRMMHNFRGEPDPMQRITQMVH